MSAIQIPTVVVVAVILGLVVVAAIYALRPERREATALDAITSVSQAFAVAL